MKAGSQSILCADDNPYFRHFVSRFLTDYGCEVVDVATASEALSLVRERPDDYDLLIVADWLPDMGGVELFQTLRSIPYAGRIVITAPELSPDQRAKYESMGASSVLITPVGYSDILRILEPPNMVGSGEHRAARRGDTTSGQAPDSSVP
jgi:two-component system, OmpR family, response regulator ResD